VLWEGREVGRAGRSIRLWQQLYVLSSSTILWLAWFKKMEYKDSCFVF
jgi:hypothetical protein